MVAAEQEFSAGGSILDETRSSMAPELLEVQTCMDDWSSATLRQQEIQRDENEDLFDFTTDRGTCNIRTLKSIIIKYDYNYRDIKVQDKKALGIKFHGMNKFEGIRKKRFKKWKVRKFEE